MPRSWYSVGLVWALLLAGCKTARQVPSNLEDACNAGDAPSCFNLGVLFANGRGVGKDEARAAATAFARGCALGDQESCAEARK